MATDFAFRRTAVKQLTNSVGVYVLCDLDNIPIYIGQSTQGIRSRVTRHLTSARSDIIANRQIDVWEIAFVWAYPVKKKSEIRPLEAQLYHYFHPKSELMNGTVPQKIARRNLPKPSQVVQVMSETEIMERKDPTQRLPRQAAHYAQLIGHFLVVKNSRQVARAMNAHFERLQKYHAKLLGAASDQPDDDEDS